MLTTEQALVKLCLPNKKETETMPRAMRKEQFLADEVCVVHCMQRCVRRAVLTGKDAVSGADYSFRREFIRRRLEALASVFGVDVLSYAVMSNHLHVILRNRPDVVAEWSDEEVALRWLKVFPGRRMEEQLAEPTDVEVQALAKDAARIKTIRTRLSDISWFMRSLAEPIARLANKHDDCTGRFWEGRFKAQRITDEAGLLACAMYVDLNPVRAGMAKSPEDAALTSANDRVRARRGEKMASAAHDLKPVPAAEVGKERRETSVRELKKRKRKRRKNPTGRRVLRDAWLSPLLIECSAREPQCHRDGLRASDGGFLQIDYDDYMRLLRWTAANRPEGQRVPKTPRAIALKLAASGIDAAMWADLVWKWQKYFGRSRCIGNPESLKAAAEQSGRRWCSGQRKAAVCFRA